MFEINQVENVPMIFSVFEHFDLIWKYFKQCFVFADTVAVFNLIFLKLKLLLVLCDPLIQVYIAAQDKPMQGKFFKNYSI